MTWSSVQSWSPRMRPRHFWTTSLKNDACALTSRWAPDASISGPADESELSADSPRRLDSGAALEGFGREFRMPGARDGFGRESNMPGARDGFGRESNMEQPASNMWMLRRARFPPLAHTTPRSSHPNTCNCPPHTVPKAGPPCARGDCDGETRHLGAGRNG